MRFLSHSILNEKGSENDNRRVASPESVLIHLYSPKMVPSLFGPVKITVVQFALVTTSFTHSFIELKLDYEAYKIAETKFKKEL